MIAPPSPTLRLLLRDNDSTVEFASRHVEDVPIGAVHLVEHRDRSTDARGDQRVCDFFRIESSMLHGRRVG